MRTLSASKTFIASVAVTILLLGLSSCENMRDSSDLYGMWQLSDYSNTETGERLTAEGTYIYYCFQLDLMNIQINRSSTKAVDKYYTYYALKGDSLIVKDNVIRYVNQDNKDSLSSLAPYGVPADGKFKIASIGDDQLVLTTKNSRLTFKKY